MARIYLIEEGMNPVHDPTVRARARRVRRARDSVLTVMMLMGLLASCGWMGYRLLNGGQEPRQDPPAVLQTQRPWIEVFVTPSSGVNSK
ncbi:hypothetical protein [Thermoflexus sp.]|uniref:hypothetical protein n=1 Tax=Thermoflexus sp. TaxID=1969742 RepID=UPI002ADE50E7|nr:hypothetical protein [Thermoflexus sp.]